MLECCGPDGLGHPTLVLDDDELLLPAGKWAFIPIHVLPALAALTHRAYAYRWLGRRMLNEANVRE